MTLFINHHVERFAMVRKQEDGEEVVQLRDVITSVLPAYGSLTWGLYHS